MLAFDASAIIYGWDNYPIEQFPRLWDWVGQQVQDGEYIMLEVAFGEVVDNEPACAEWLKGEGLQIAPVTEDILTEACRIKELLGIVEDNYCSNGVGENDLFIVSHARIWEVRLVTNEAIQNILPKDRRKMKIPSVCDLPEIGVRHTDFVKILKESKQVF